MRTLLTTIILLLLTTSSHGQSPPPGERYTVGDRSLHMTCVGEGSPTVVMDAGVGGFTLNWAFVQPEVAQFTRACAYDRAGYGWSDVLDTPYDPLVAVSDLHQLLAIAGEQPPYILVGHSFGGLHVRLYQQTYPEQVAGIVLVDAVHLQMPRRISSYPEALERQLDALRLLSGFARLSTVQRDDSVIPLSTEVPNAEIYVEKMLEPNFFETSYEEALFLAYEMPSLDVSDDLGDLPLIVISHGIGEERSFLGAPLRGSEAVEAEAIWQELQQELAMLSSRGELVIASESQHNIQFDQPELVSDAIYRVWQLSQR